MKKLNAYQLKLICAFIMVFDHISFFLPIEAVSIIHVISRCVSPLFAYLVVEGAFHTHDLKRYNIRLFGWAAFMQVGNIVINMLYKNKEVAVHNNIFLTLSCGLICISLIKVVKDSKIGVRVAAYIGAIVIAILGLFMCEGGSEVIPFMLITFLFKNKKAVQYTLYIIFSFILFKISFVQYGSIKATIDMLMFNSDFMFVLALPLIALYNGERGPRTAFSKYFFYVFYPAHLWILATIEYLIK